MYRYSVDNAITYTSEDFVLFRESPFACWMERLTLENPEHAIPADLDSNTRQTLMERQDDVADTLRAEGRDVILVDWDEDEPYRRTATLDAMRRGTDFIVNGQLALGPLSGSADLLMRTSGYSDLGGFLYIPCYTQTRASLHAGFRLSFLADLLHSLQGQLPPQMLIIRGGADLLPLETEDHIYHYRAVKQRFMETMRSFRKHRMPDPAESSHFGRWSDCANEVLKQRALRGDDQQDEATAAEHDIPVPLAVAAGGSSAYDLDDLRGPSPEPAADCAGVDAPLALQAVMPDLADTTYAATGAQHTLAEQALMLAPGAYAAEARELRPGPTPNLARFPVAEDDEEQADQQENSPEGTIRFIPEPEISDSDRRAEERRSQDRRGLQHSGGNRRSSDVALQNLQFIGSSNRDALIGIDDDLPPSLDTGAGAEVESAGVEGEIAQAKPHPLDSAGFNLSVDSVMDMDAVPGTSLPPVLDTADTDPMLATPVEAGYDVDIEVAEAEAEAGAERETATLLRSFSDSLITSDQYPD